MKRPAFWILLALASLAAVAVGVRLFPAGLLDRRARHHDGPRARARGRAADPGARPPRSTRLPPGGVVRARRRGADVRRARRRRQRGVHRHAARRALRRLHLARAALQGRGDQRDDHPLHARRASVRIRGEAEGGRAGRRARRRLPRGGSPRPAPRRGGMFRSMSTGSSSRGRNGGPAAASITPSPTNARSHAQRGPLSRCGSSSRAIA